jgi:hypothetical protein
MTQNSLPMPGAAGFGRTPNCQNTDSRELEATIFAREQRATFSRQLQPAFNDRLAIENSVPAQIGPDALMIRGSRKHGHTPGARGYHGGMDRHRNDCGADTESALGPVASRWPEDDTIPLPIPGRRPAARTRRQLVLITRQCGPAPDDRWAARPMTTTILQRRRWPANNT